ncbi:MAG TPA: response regulator [Planctomycetota bacterium]
MRPAFLLVEDDPDDALLLRRSLARFQRQVAMSWTTDVPSALEHLAHPPYPFLVLTDVNLPRSTGWDVLRWTRSRAETQSLPVLVWTSLPTPEGAARAQALGAARYFSKPRDAAGYMGVASLIHGYLGD